MEKDVGRSLEVNPCHSRSPDLPSSRVWAREAANPPQGLQAFAWPCPSASKKKAPLLLDYLDRTPIKAFPRLSEISPVLRCCEVRVSFWHLGGLKSLITKSRELQTADRLTIDQFGHKPDPQGCLGVKGWSCRSNSKLPELLPTAVALLYACLLPSACGHHDE